MTIDAGRLRRTLAELVRRDSTNPALGEGGAGEGAMADYVEEEMRRIGLEVDRWDAAPGRPNVVGTLRSPAGTGRSLMLNAHMDTVGVEGMATPFEPRVEEGRMYGRGTQDMKGSLAAQLAAAEALGASLQGREGHPLVGAPSLHAGLLRGGAEPSVYAARCRLRLERRTIPGETAEDALAEVESILGELRAEDEAFDAEAQVAFQRAPLETSADAPLAEATRAGTAEVLGQPASDVGASFWTDAALLQAAGIETVVLGPVGAGLHTTEEWVDLASVEQLAEGLARTARRYCGK